MPIAKYISGALWLSSARCEYGFRCTLSMHKLFSVTASSIISKISIFRSHALTEISTCISNLMSISSGTSDHMCADTFSLDVRYLSDHRFEPDSYKNQVEPFGSFEMSRHISALQNKADLTRPRRVKWSH